MKVSMTLKESLCIKYAEKFKKVWDNYCISKDSYLNGFNDAVNLIASNTYTDIEEIDKVTNVMVELEMNNGTHVCGTHLGQVDE